MNTSSKPSVRDVLRNHDFRALWLGQVLSDFGDGMNNLALLVLIQRLTGSTTALATMAVLAALPRILIGPVAGVYVDRWSRKRVMIISDLLRGFLVLFYILVRHPEHVWILYLVGFLQASVSTFFTPARSALLPNLLEEEELLAANSLSQTSQVVMNLLGMAAAGAIIGALNLYWPAFVLDSATFFISMLLIALIRAVPKPRTKVNTDTLTHVWREIRLGLSTMAHSRLLVGILAAAGVSMLGLGAANILLVPFLLDDLSLHPTWLSLVQGAVTGGMILSGSLVTVLAARLKPTTLVSLALVGIGLTIGATSQATHIWQVLGLLFGAGLCVTPLNAATMTIFQTAVSDELRGRVGASLNMVITTGQITSMAVAGVLADMMGVRMVFLLAGGINILASVVAAWVFAGRLTPHTSV